MLARAGGHPSLAAEFSSAEIISIGTGPVLLPTPQNVTLYTHEVDCDWNTIPFDRGKRFDLIHGRMLASCIKDWLRFFEQAMQRLRPGGWLELNEFQFDVFSLNIGDCSAVKSIRSMAQTYRETGKMRGFSLNAAVWMREMMRAAGFMSVQGEEHDVRLILPVAALGD